MNIIRLDHVTKDYGHGKGIFNISMQIHKGEVYGYLGPNGAGKTTTIRHLMGFIKADQGSVTIRRKNCWSKQKEIQNSVGYLPGEIAFPNDMKASAYIKMIAKLRHMKSMNRADEIIQLFELDTSVSLKRMSKGMKQKVGIVTAFMHEPSLLILDEPTSGLDPLMQNRFVELIEQEKKKGTTILMSSHMFDEVERTCTRVGIIKDGRIIEEKNADELRHSRKKSYKIEFFKQEEFALMCELPFEKTDVLQDKLQMIVHVNDASINELLRTLSAFHLKYLNEIKHSLEDYFMQFYGGEHHD